jgi:hypothetical protein
VIETPILLIATNNPENLKHNIDICREVEAEHIMFFANGPRYANKNDATKCKDIRQMRHDFDWGAFLNTRIKHKHLGYNEMMNVVMEWLFRTNEYGIIINDRFKVSKEFIVFADSALKKYAGNRAIMSISSFVSDEKLNFERDDYFFSHFCNNEIWATWKRAWDLFEPKGRNAKDKGLSEFLTLLFKDDTLAHKTAEMIKDHIYQKPHNWDSLWQLNLLINQGLCLYPKHNLRTSDKTEPVKFLPDLEKEIPPDSNSDYDRYLVLGDKGKNKLMDFIKNFRDKFIG